MLAIGLGPGPNICGAPRSGERQIEIELDIPQLIRQLVFTCVRECGRRGSTLVGRQSRHGSSRLATLAIESLGIAGQRPPARSS